MENESKKLTTLLKALDTVPTPLNFEYQINKKIRAIEEKSRRQNFFALCCTSAVSFTAGIWTFFYLLSTINASGIYEYLSLVTSNSTEIITYWREISFSIIESLPYMTIAIFLGILAMFVWSVVQAINTTSIKFKSNILQA